MLVVALLLHFYTVQKTQERQITKLWKSFKCNFKGIQELAQKYAIELEMKMQKNIALKIHNVLTSPLSLQGNRDIFPIFANFASSCQYLSILANSVGITNQFLFILIISHFSWQISH